MNTCRQARLLSPKCNIAGQFGWPSYQRVPAGCPTQIRLAESKIGERGPNMRLESVEYRLSQSDERKPANEEIQQNQLTPARQAALNALEREFREMLKAARASGAV
ncbi:MAG TPA: hypothetical protein VFC45_05730 [Pseudolabrys sp.]|nr:hypothetical protein [Pseudolabrys sp.]